MASSSTSRSCSGAISPRARRSRASSRRWGRRKLPTWSARKGGCWRTVMVTAILKLTSSSMKPSPRIPGLRLLHSPGPTRVPDEVVNAMARQPTDLADGRLHSLIAACESGMKALLMTERADVFFYAANGHGGWEAVIANLVAPGASVLVPGTGHFSDGWAEQVEAFGGTAVRTPYVEGLPIDPAAVE